MTDRGEREMEETEMATFAGGCFWCMEAVFDGVDGVIKVISGYTGGGTENPTYEAVSGGRTGHYEAIQIAFDPSKITYRELLEIFWRNIDPTDATGQFADKGSQYGTAIFYHSEEQRSMAQESKEKLARSGVFDRHIVTEIIPFSRFYPAEKHHQEYHKRCPIRYQAYKHGSGRVVFLKGKWG
jgi:peptide methionine sulfoxide reductase msrA/msrB